MCIHNTPCSQFSYAPEFKQSFGDLNKKSQGITLTKLILTVTISFKKYFICEIQESINSNAYNNSLKAEFNLSTRHNANCLLSEKHKKKLRLIQGMRPLIRTKSSPTNIDMPSSPNVVLATLMNPSRLEFHPWTSIVSLHESHENVPPQYSAVLQFSVAPEFKQSLGSK